jgi:hypothetical protein
MEQKTIGRSGNPRERIAGVNLRAKREKVFVVDAALISTMTPLAPARDPECDTEAEVWPLSGGRGRAATMLGNAGLPLAIWPGARVVLRDPGIPTSVNESDSHDEPTVTVNRGRCNQLNGLWSAWPPPFGANVGHAIPRAAATVVTGRPESRHMILTGKERPSSYYIVFLTGKERPSSYYIVFLTGKERPSSYYAVFLGGKERPSSDTLTDP